MAKFATRHKDREKYFSFNTFSDGLNQEISPNFLSQTALTRCKNMQYFLSKDAKGETVISVRKRQGTEAITLTALGAAVTACTYYVNGGYYIVATDSKVYYIDNATYAPVEIGSVEGACTFSEFHGKLIIHDSGVTKAWNGTTFETLTCYYEDESLGTGNNSDVAFSGTLAHPVVKTSSLTITYTDTTTKTITDDGAGNLTGDCVSGTINYTTGAYSFTCTGAPDNTTVIYAAYEKVAGSPKSKAGLVRASRLYLWGDADNPSRLWYCGTNDEDAWDSSSSGGYVDVDPLDGYSLVGCLNFYADMVLIKGNSMHRLVSFPGESDFAVKPLFPNTGAVAYRTVLNAGPSLLITYLSNQGWLSMKAGDDYGDIDIGPDLSRNFSMNAVKFAYPSCYAEYNQNDKQVWLTLYNNSVQSDVVYVVSLETGGQLSLYEFEFGHTCYKFVNGEMLIGGSDGHLYRLLSKGTKYTDNDVSYTDNCYFRTVMTNFGLPLNRKHNKRLYLHSYGSSGMTCTLNIYTNGNYGTPIYTSAISIGGGQSLIYDLQSTDIYDMTAQIAAENVAESPTVIHSKFNYREVMVEITDIDGDIGAEFFGVDLHGAILGE